MTLVLIFNQYDVIPADENQTPAGGPFKRNRRRFRFDSLQRTIDAERRRRRHRFQMELTAFIRDQRHIRMELVRERLSTRRPRRYRHENEAQVGAERRRRAFRLELDLVGLPSSSRRFLRALRA